MANAVRVENISHADRELAPGSGFIPAGGSVDYPVEIYRDKHEQYAKPLLENDPPLIKLTEFDSPEIARRAPDLQKQAEDDKKAQEERAAAELLAEAEKKAAEQKQAEEAQRQQGEGASRKHGR
jgi:hypothetical protein